MLLIFFIPSAFVSASTCETMLRSFKSLIDGRRCSRPCVNLEFLQNKIKRKEGERKKGGLMGGWGELCVSS